MNLGGLAHTRITDNTDHFDLNEMLCPNFVNNGRSPVIVFHQLIPPLGQFGFNFPQLILKGGIPIQFLEPAEPAEPDDTTPLKQLDVYYGTLKNC